MKRALLIGINQYPGQPLNGCVNDITDMADLLVSSQGFATDDIRLLSDDRATADAIRDRIKWLDRAARHLRFRASRPRRPSARSR
jgi:hypothetical protein